MNTTFTTREMAHELNNSLTICNGYINMIDINNPEKTLKYINIIKMEIKRSINMLENTMNIYEFNIADLISDIDTIFNEIIDIKINVDKHLIKGNYNLLKQVLINIIKNSIEADATKIEISTTTKNNRLIIKIKDNGQGIDEKNLIEMHSTKKSGHGIGTKINFEIIKNHNGSLKYYSKVHYGTEVIINLPMV